MSIFQRLIPTYGNWGGPGHSAGIWNDDPSKTDWTVPGIDAMDEAFKRHDHLYQTTNNRQYADRLLVWELDNIEVKGLYANAYRIAALYVFTIRSLF